MEYTDRVVLPNGTQFSRVDADGNVHVKIVDASGFTLNYTIPKQQKIYIERAMTTLQPDGSWKTEEDDG